MKLSKYFVVITDLVKRENIFTPRFKFWYLIVLIVAVIVIVAFQIIPVIQDNIRFNKDIREGRVYVPGQDFALIPKIEDFILDTDGTIQLNKFYPHRLPTEEDIRRYWNSETIEEYWDDVDQKKLNELRQENRRILQQRLENLP